MRISVLVSGLVLAVMTASGALGLDPMWELDAECAHPQMVTIATSTGDHTFWYVTYTIKNSSDDLRKEIRPIVRLVSNKGKAYNDILEPTVMAKLKAKGLDDLYTASSAAVDLKPGDTIRGAAVFNKVSHDASTLTLWIHGVAGKRVEKRGDVSGIYSRAYKVVFSYIGDQYSFTPQRLKLESRGFVSTFRSAADYDNIVEETIEIISAEEKVRGRKPKAKAATTAVKAAVVEDTDSDDELVADEEEDADEPVESASGVTDPFSLMPTGFDALLCVNAAKMAEVGIIDAIVEMINTAVADEGPSPAEVIEKLKIDLKKDLKTMVLGFTVPKDDGDQPQGVFVIQGKFDVAAVYAFAQESTPGSYEVKYAGVKYLTDEDGAAFCVLGTEYVVGASGDSILKKVIDVYKGTARPAAQTKLMTRLNALRSKMLGFTMMDVTIPELGEEEAAGMAMMMPGFDPAKLKTVTVSADMVGKNFTLKADAGCEDEDTAEAAAGGMKQMVNMANGIVGMMAAQQPEVGKAFNGLLKGLSIDFDGTIASLEITITPELGEELKGLAETLKDMTGGMGVGDGGGMEFDNGDWEEGNAPGEEYEEEEED